MDSTEDNRLKEFAEVLVDRCTEVEQGENVYIMCLSSDSLPLFKEVRRKVIKRGAVPYESILFDTTMPSGRGGYDWFENSSEDQINSFPQPKMDLIKEMDVYIRIGGQDNSQELSGINPEKISKWKKNIREISDERLSKKWVATRFPTNSAAQKAEMSTKEYEELIFSAVNTDYDKLEKKNKRIKEAFDNAETVEIQSKETDLKLSLKNRNGVSAHGKRNIPDGEVFYAPVKESIEGHIKFTYPGINSGNEVHGIKLWFENGEIVDFEAEKNEEYLEKMINTDEGSKFIGELGIGTNEEITEFTKDTLLDEKMAGTIHMALGRAYEECVPDGEERNDSSVHWDIVNDLRPRDGGGKIILDGKTVQKDGEWKI